MDIFTIIACLEEKGVLTSEETTAIRDRLKFLNGLSMTDILLFMAAELIGGGETPADNTYFILLENGDYDEDENDDLQIGEEAP